MTKNKQNHQFILVLCLVAGVVAITVGYIIHTQPSDEMRLLQDTASELQIPDTDLRVIIDAGTVVDAKGARTYNRHISYYYSGLEPADTVKGALQNQGWEVVSSDDMMNSQNREVYRKNALPICVNLITGITEVPDAISNEYTSSPFSITIAYEDDYSLRCRAGSL